jgi:hypothetical protein
MLVCTFNLAAGTIYHNFKAQVRTDSLQYVSNTFFLGGGDESEVIYVLTD